MPAVEDSIRGPLKLKSVPIENTIDSFELSDNEPVPPEPTVFIVILPLEVCLLFFYKGNEIILFF